MEHQNNQLLDRLLKAPSWRIASAKLNAALTLCSLAVAFLGPFIFLSHYQTTYGYPPEIVSFGWLLIALLVLASYAIILLLAAVFKTVSIAFWARFFTCVLTLLSIGTGLIYISAYISNSAWGDTVTYNIAATFAQEPGALLEFLPFSKKSQWILMGLVLTALMVLICGAFLTCRFLAGQLLIPITAWLREGSSFTERRRRVFLTVGPLSLAIASSATAIGLFVQSDPGRLVGEPISSFLSWFPAADTLHMDSVRLQAALDDRRARAGYPKTVEFDRKNVVFIFADSLRADRMGVYAYERDTSPFLSGLYRKGQLHKVDMALSTCSESYCGIASTFASRPFHEVSHNSLKLHSLLMDLGYRANFFLSGDHRAWNYVYEFYGKDVHNFHDYITDKGYSIDDDRRILAGLQGLPRFSGQPNFFYLFLMSSHVTGTRYPEYQRYTPAEFDGIQSFWNEVGGTQRVDGRVSARRTLAPRELTILSNRYDNGVVQTDAMIGRIFGILSEKGYLKDSLVIIMGDHGDGLGEHGHLGHTRSLYQEDIRIPLLIYDGDTSVYRERRFATQIDIAPTILDRLGLPLPATWQGKSLLRPAQERLTLHQTRRGVNLCRAVVASSETALFKYLRCGAANSRTEEELYNLDADPLERTNILRTVAPDLLHRLRREIDSRFTLSTNRCESFECRD